MGESEPKGGVESGRGDRRRSTSAERHRANSPEGTDRYVKRAIPRALREQVWIKHMGRAFEGKCRVGWCTNRITVFDFQAGHNIPEVQGGETSLDNLIPICSRCNQSMGSQYTITEWNQLGCKSLPWRSRWKAKARMFCTLLLK